MKLSPNAFIEITSPWMTNSPKSFEVPRCKILIFVFMVLPSRIALMSSVYSLNNRKFRLIADMKSFCWIMGRLIGGTLKILDCSDMNSVNDEFVSMSRGLRREREPWRIRERTAMGLT